MTQRSVSHATFVIERSYDVPPARVYAAWSDPKAKGRWFVGPDIFESSDHKMDFRIGGKESVSGGPPGGPVYSFAATYQDIVPDQRIVTTYEMHMGEQRISVSLATVELKPEGEGTKLVLTEMGAFLDGLDNVQAREEGTKVLLDNLGKALAG